MRLHSAIMVAMLLVVGVALCDGPYFGFIIDDSEPHKLVKNMKKVAVGHSPQSKVIEQKNGEHYFIKVTEAVYNAGFAVLTTNEVNNLVDVAISNSADYEEWDTRSQAIIETMRTELNAIRTDPKVNLPEITEAEMKQKVKDKKPKKKK